MPILGHRQTTSPSDLLMQRGICLIGNGQASVCKNWEELLGMIQKGELDPLQMVSYRARLEDLDNVYHWFDERVSVLTPRRID